MAISSIHYKGVFISMRDVVLEPFFGYFLTSIEADPAFQSRDAIEKIRWQLSNSGAGMMSFDMDDYLREENDKILVLSYLADFEKNIHDMSAEKFSDWLNEIVVENTWNVGWGRWEYGPWKPGPEQRNFFKEEATRIRDLLNEQLDPDKDDGAYRIP